MFNIGVSRDGIKLGDSMGLNSLDKAEGVNWEYLADSNKELRPDQVDQYDALVLFGSRVTKATLQGVERLAVIARLGVGYDTVDVDACTESGVILTITPDGVRRGVASSAVTFILSLSHNLIALHNLTRSGGWGQQRDSSGFGIDGRTLGLIGLGNIGQEIVKLIKPHGMKIIAHDPYVSKDVADDMDVSLTDLGTLMSTSDFVCVCCALTPETLGVVDESKFKLMKKDSYFINVARGPIVDQKALTDILTRGAIRGAGLDVFEKEPIDADDPLLKLDNVIVTPHSVCLTDTCARAIGSSALRSALTVRDGDEPQYIVNKEVLSSAITQAKLRSFRDQN